MNLHPPCKFPLMTLSSGQLCEGTQTAWVDGQSSDLWNSGVSHYTSLLNPLVIIRRKESGTRESLRLVCTTHFKRKMNSLRSLFSSKETPLQKAEKQKTKTKNKVFIYHLQTLQCCRSRLSNTYWKSYNGVIA